MHPHPALHRGEQAPPLNSDSAILETPSEAKGDEEHLPGASGIPEAALGSGRKLDDWVITCKTTTFITVEQ